MRRQVKDYCGVIWIDLEYHPWAIIMGDKFGNPVRGSLFVLRAVIDGGEQDLLTNKRN